MLKEILKLSGARQLSKAEQKGMSGAIRPIKADNCCNPALDCCVPNPGPVSCTTWGNSSCRYLYSDPNSTIVPCCI